MKLIVAGGRNFNDYGLLRANLDFYLKKVNKSTLTLLCGGARGADSLGEKYFKDTGLGDQVKYFIPDWDTHGKGAGFIRNEEMAKEGTHLIAFWDGISRGTDDMIKRARKHNLIVVVVNY